MLNLDTHIFLFAVTGALRPKEARLLSENRWGISAIGLWEIAKLAELGHQRRPRRSRSRQGSGRRARLAHHSRNRTHEHATGIAGRPCGSADRGYERGARRAIADS